MSSAPTAAPLRWWSQAWRYAVAVGIAVLGVGTVGSAAPDYARNTHGLVGLDLLLGVASLVLLGWRRRWPLAVAAAITAAGAVSVSSTGPWTVAVASLATRRRWWEILPILALTMAAQSTVSALYPDPGTDHGLTMLMTLLSAIVIIALGAYTGARRDLVTSLWERAETAEREQSARALQARTAERAAIAREMHDVLAHRISQVAMHAGALAYRDDLTPEQTRDAAETIQRTAHQALVELRGVLGVLRSGAVLDAAGLPARPQPTPADLDDLVAELRSAGSTVHVQDERSSGVSPPPLVARHGYRILQEACTNARKHAPGAPIWIGLSGAPGGDLVVEVVNLTRRTPPRPIHPPYPPPPAPGWASSASPSAPNSSAVA